MMYLVSKAWNAVGMGARDVLNVIVVLDYQLQEEAHNGDLIEM